MSGNGIFRFGVAAVFVAAGASTAHLVVLHRAGSLAVPFVMLCALAAGVSLWGRFRWSDIGTALAFLGDMAREVAGTAVRVRGFVSGVLWLGLCILFGRISWVVYGSSLLRTFGESLWETTLWCGASATVICLAKCAIHWSTVFAPSSRLENQHVHGDARLATESEAARHARGGSSRGSVRADFNY